MNPKSGKAGSAVSPADAEKALEADTADPGEVDKFKAEQINTQSGKYGSTQVKPYKPPETQEEREEKSSWIEIEMVDEDDQPVPGERYSVVLPDNTEATGTLDQNGLARIDGIKPGTCKISFPDLDKDAWSKI